MLLHNFFFQRQLALMREVRQSGTITIVLPGGTYLTKTHRKTEVIMRLESEHLPYSCFLGPCKYTLMKNNARLFNSKNIRSLFFDTDAFHCLINGEPQYCFEKYCDFNFSQAHEIASRFNVDLALPRV